ncbi:hypothetical protein AH04_35 [Erwinia phage AH04]|uniref:Uncharacterized protein n=1 Tax=Erwinia phage AH04 TaxID=2869569 RepID=A0AAE7X0G6_9CAUD|nr:hypothetical protein PQC02_gp279 [Erwinia phage AH04]QZA70522.1 hypothetical protein AH04_35 [Erwinia phage AH04]
MQTQLVSLTIGPIVEHYLETTPLSQGIIGIQVPGFITVDDLNKLVTELFALGIGTSEMQTVIIPPPQLGTFDASKKADVESIGGRVFRDRNDGIRYNRVYIALYWDDLGKLNSMRHDIFFQVEERQVGGYQVSITDNREFGGDKVVYGNQLKSVIGTLASQSEDKPVDMLFSLKSLMLRKPDDFWIEFPEFTDEKLMAANLLKYVQDNEQIFTNVIWVIKDRISKGTFGVGIILEFPKCLNIRVIMTDGPRGKFVRIQVGMTFFFFSIDRPIIHDWVKLMINQLEAHMNAYLLAKENEVR